MKLSALLAPLIAAKASHATIMEVVLAFEAEQGDANEVVAAKREAARQRQIKHRAAKRHVMSRDVTVTQRDMRDNEENTNEINSDVTQQSQQAPRAHVEDNLQTKNLSGQEEKDISPANAVDREFAETFWPAYPLKRDRGHALKAFRLARQRASLEIIMAGVRRYAAERVGDDPKFTKYAQGWLSGDGWADEARPPSPPPRAASPPNGKRPNALDAYQEIARERGWTSEPEILPSHNGDAQRLSSEPGGHSGVVVDLRRRSDGHFGPGD